MAKRRFACVRTKRAPRPFRIGPGSSFDPQEEAQCPSGRTQKNVGVIAQMDTQSSLSRLVYLWGTLLRK